MFIDVFGRKKQNFLFGNRTRQNITPRPNAYEKFAFLWKILVTPKGTRTQCRKISRQSFVPIFGAKAHTNRHLNRQYARIFDKIRRIAAIRKSSGTIHLTNFSPCVIICLPLCYMAFSYNMTTVVKQLKVWRGAQLASPLSAVACSLFPIGLGVRNFALRCFEGQPEN